MAPEERGVFGEKIDPPGPGENGQHGVVAPGLMVPDQEGRSLAVRELVIDFELWMEGPRDDKAARKPVDKVKDPIGLFVFAQSQL